MSATDRAAQQRHDEVTKQSRRRPGLRMIAWLMIGLPAAALLAAIFPVLPLAGALWAAIGLGAAHTAGTYATRKSARVSLEQATADLQGQGIDKPNKKQIGEQLEQGERGLVSGLVRMVKAAVLPPKIHDSEKTRLRDKPGQMATEIANKKVLQRLGVTEQELQTAEWKKIAQSIRFGRSSNGEILPGKFELNLPDKISPDMGKALEELNRVTGKHVAKGKKVAVDSDTLKKLLDSGDLGKGTSSLEVLKAQNTPQNNKKSGNQKGQGK